MPQFGLTPNRKVRAAGFLRQLRSDQPMGNIFAYFMLAAWPAIAIVLTKKKAPDTAVILLLLVPYLILPPIITLNLGITSSLDKYIVASLVALLIVRARFGAMHFLPKSFSIRILIFLLVLSPFLTLLYNRDPIFLPNRVIPGLTIKDVINMELFNFCWIYIPFLLGYTWLGNPGAHGKLLAIVSVAGLVYSVPMLWEVRMSPQLNIKLYGFFPSGFEQQIRAGGFRPVVFLEHGLRVAVFFAMSIMATMTIYKVADKNKKTERKSRLKLIYMLAVMFLCKTWSALIYTAIAIAIFVATKPKMWMRFSVIVVALIFAFPFVRTANVLPIHQVSDFFSQYSSDRAGSLQYRFDNEDILLDRANERPLAGWGGWGRSRVYDATGKDISVTDGTWIIVFGVTGWIGYIAEFGFVLLPVFFVSRKLRANPQLEVPVCTAGIFIILAFNMIDLIPNSSITPFIYLLSGALMGYASLQAHAHDSSVVRGSAKGSAKLFVRFRDLMQ